MAVDAGVGVGLGSFKLWGPIGAEYMVWYKVRVNFRVSQIKLKAPKMEVDGLTQESKSQPVTAATKDTPVTKK